MAHDASPRFSRTPARAQSAPPTHRALTPRRSARPRTQCTVALAIVILLAPVLVLVPAFAEPILPGLSATRLEPPLQGQVLIEELNCVACHSARDELAAASRPAPLLARIGSRLNHAHVETLLQSPHGTKPGALMPDLLHVLPPTERAPAARALTHFLFSLGTNAAPFAPTPPDPVAARLGQRLFHARGCAACHAPRDDRAAEQSMPLSLPLGPLHGKYSFKSLVEFLRAPHSVRPGRRMPDLRLAQADLERIAHYLLQETRVPGHLSYTLYRGEVWKGLDHENVTAERGGQVADFALTNLARLSHHSGLRYEGWLLVSNRGPHRFFATFNGGSLDLDGRRLIDLAPSDRRGPRSLDASVDLDPGWHRLVVTYVHTGREAAFKLEMESPGHSREPIPAARLATSHPPAPAYSPLAIEPALAERGRALFHSLQCVRCHTDVATVGGTAPPAAPNIASPLANPRPFAELNPGSNRGCLSGTPGAWPDFALSADQRTLIAAALPTAAERRLEPAERLAKTFATFQCLACHDREGLGGISPERRALFTGTQPSMGDHGRIPPPLTHVGARLQPGWIAEVLLEGKRERRYLDASMPQFGERQVGHLVQLFGELDRLESAPQPPPMDPAAAKTAGHSLLGANGLACIACHEFNGQPSGEIAAIDLASAPRRLQRNWFHLFLRQPTRFHPTIIMPAYWPDGVSPLTNILAGDATRQIEALWSYLEDGPRARKPVGLSRESTELRVGDTPEICRGQSSIGFRGIAVGYPERLNLAFDAGEMALRQLWKGEFANVDPGTFRPRGTDLISFPPGIPFHRLPAPDAPWPAKGRTNYPFPHDHGYEFRGYHLDARRRPTFRYNYGAVAVEDFFEDVAAAAGPGNSSGPAWFRRTLRFQAPAGTTPFTFRAAAGSNVTAESAQAFRVDRLKLRILSPHEGTVREGSPGEVLIPIAPPPGTSTLQLQYEW